MRQIRVELARRLALLRRCSGATCRRGPDLKLRVASSKGRQLRAGVVGADVPWVAATRFYVNGKWVAVDRRAPFSVVLPPSLLNGSLSTIGARVRTTDGRSVTMTRTVPGPSVRESRQSNCDYVGAQ